MKNGRLIIFTLILIIITVICKRYLGADATWSGFSPVIAIALFSGFIIKERNMSFLMPLLALFISDLTIQLLHNADIFPYAGFYDGQWKNYLILLSATLIGLALKGRSFKTLAAGSLIAPTVFFLISNFNVWLNAGESFYPKTFSGLMTCYEAGLPFYRNALIATLIFLPAIAFTYNYMTRKKTQVVLA